ncbi:MAG: hypothetical protein M4579_001544 [Chaenotheca gracillima]|nr:MAG: hypothetical protein M4579_001544 [Chaenotheca gracillima]
MQKYPPFAAVNVSQTSSVSAGSLLTPPSNIPGDGLSPISSSVHSGSSGSNPAGPPYTPAGYWAPPTSTGSPYGFGVSMAPQNPYGAQTMNMSGRSMFSPSLTSLGRNNSNSPTGADGLPPPPYDLSLPPFHTSGSMSGQGGSMGSGLPTLAAQQQAMANVMMHSQTPGSNAQTPPLPVPELYHQNSKLPPTPSYYGHPQSAPPQQTNFSQSYHASSPGQQSPASAVSASRISPLSNNHGNHPPALQPAPTNSSHFSRPFNYQLPAVGGPIMSNLHSPGGQLSLVGGPGGSMSGGMMSAYGGHHNGMAHLYGSHPHHQHQQQQQNERPFKCDVCPQSFNRNHDLKRHKRIHLAVKPFPCGHCDKSFSRKDALKRHILVKGCGKKGSGSDPKHDDGAGSTSPPDKSDELLSSDGEGGDDDGHESPIMMNGNVKNELR